MADFAINKPLFMNSRGVHQPNLIDPEVLENHGFDDVSFAKDSPRQIVELNGKPVRTTNVTWLLRFWTADQSDSDELVSAGSALRLAEQPTIGEICKLKACSGRSK
jgi:hypothetical protein